MRPDDSDGFREAWAILERLWDGTIERARRLPEEALHRGEQLAARVTRTEPGYPQEKDFPVKERLTILLTEEWEHRRYAERDLTVLEQTGLEQTVLEKEA